MSKNKDDIVQEEVVDEAVNDYEPEPGPTPEQQEEEERERQAIEAAKLKPYRDIKNAINEHDDLMAETLYEITMLEIGMEG